MFPTENNETSIRTAPETVADVKDPRNRNVGTSDYAKHKIQPYDIWNEYQMNPFDADIIKRILRTKINNGMSAEESRIEDYSKIIHICQTRIQHIKDGNYYYRGT